MIYLKEHLKQMIFLTFIQFMASNFSKKILIRTILFLLRSLKYKALY